MSAIPNRLVALGVLFGLVAGLMVSAQAADGLKPSTDAETSLKWQARVSVIAAPTLMNLGWNGGEAAQSAILLTGERYFSFGRLGSGGGLRATSALMLGGRNANLRPLASWANGPARSTGNTAPASVSVSEPLDASPSAYVGVGYSTWFNKASLGLSADLGLLGQRGAGGLRSGRSWGAESLDDQHRVFQLAPVLQVNMAYTF